MRNSDAAPDLIGTKERSFSGTKLGGSGTEVEADETFLGREKLQICTREGSALSERDFVFKARHANECLVDLHHRSFLKVMAAFVANQSIGLKSDVRPLGSRSQPHSTDGRTAGLDQDRR
jgi:hypothetical protein